MNYFNISSIYLLNSLLGAYVSVSAYVIWSKINFKVFRYSIWYNADYVTVGERRLDFLSKKYTVFKIINLVLIFGRINSLTWNFFKLTKLFSFILVSRIFEYVFLFYQGFMWFRLKIYNYWNSMWLSLRSLEFQ